MKLWFHDCELTANPPNKSGNWNCDANREDNFNKECQSGLRDFYQSKHLQSYKCMDCDFDVCLKCMLHHLKEKGPKTYIREGRQ